MKKTQKQIDDELEMQPIRAMQRDGVDILKVLYAMWYLGESGNEIARKEVREILHAAMRDRRENQRATPVTTEEINSG